MAEHTVEPILDLRDFRTTSAVSEPFRFADELAVLQREIEPLIAQHIRAYDLKIHALLMAELVCWAVWVVQARNPDSV